VIAPIVDRRPPYFRSKQTERKADGEGVDARGHRKREQGSPVAHVDAALVPLVIVLAGGACLRDSRIILAPIKVSRPKAIQWSKPRI
jgi:hypothetical protein